MLPYDRVADELQTLLPLLDLPYGCIPAGQGSVVLDLVGKARIATASLGLTSATPASRRS